MTTFEDIKEIALQLKDKEKLAEVKSVLRRHIPVPNPKLADIPEYLYDKVMSDLIVLRDGIKVHGYAYNSTVSPAVVIHGVGIKHYMPGEEIKTLHPEPDNTAEQVEALARKTQMPPAIAAPYGKHALQVNRTIETREDAIAAVKELQEKWDLIDDVQVAETLMGKMEERHGEEFNAFFEASVRQVMLAAGLQQVKINTSDILLTLASGTRMRVREEPGFLIYEMVEDNDA